ncbi:Do family serine endopeptidase [Hyphococcus flavus]|uniref:Do family serine endopeptidase n=1 Tax=Hyphococcus flavus TaxID=1866326 RepID=A0AAF0CBY5_9PROT|nr:Do family serine endopeptidase [Hyphococcus flavus]WDI32140.1 Do family serine endopeptidase [Hyphococcus flavus]
MKLRNQYKIRRSPKRSVFAITAAGAAAAALSIAGLGFHTANAQAPRLMAPPVSADGTLSFADLVERVSPAVVSILVEREVETPRIPDGLEQFFNFRFGDPGERTPDNFDDGVRRMEAQGSGFFIDNDGHIVTNNHVVADADEVRVRLSNGDEVSAEVIGLDPLTDLAVLKVEPPRNQSFVEFADDVNLRVGDFVLAVGNPYGLNGTVTSGIVSAIGGQNRENQYLDFIQIDAPINRGNSGGPTFDLKGRVVGVNTAIYSPTGGSVGIGFAIPARVAKDTVAQLIANGSVTRGWLGIQLQEVTTEIAAAIGLKESGGVLVADVIDNTPAQRAGLMDGDVILGVAGEDVETSNELSRRVASFPPGEKISLKIHRDGKVRNLDVTLGQRDDDQTASAEDVPSNDDDSLAADLGLRVSELNDAMRQQFRVPDNVDGVMVTGVRPGSPAQEAGLQPGVVILQVDGEDVASGNDLRSKIQNAKRSDKDAVLLRMQFGANRQFGALSLDTE